MGFGWCGGSVALTERRILNVKIRQEAFTCNRNLKRGCCKAVAADEGQSRVIAMLQSPSGATIAAMMKAIGWQPHSVRGFLAGVVRKRLKLKLTSKTIAGTRVYQVTRATDGSRQSRRRPS